MTKVEMPQQLAQKFSVDRLDAFLHSAQRDFSSQPIKGFKHG